MSRGLKRFFIVCAVAAGVGLVFAVAGFALGGVGNVDRVSDKYDWLTGSPGEMKYMDVDHASDFDSVRIKGDMDVRIIRGDHDSVRIGYGENLKAPVTQFADGALIIDARSESNGITINFSSRDYEPFVEITCRDARTLDVIEIETENGDVDICGIEVGSIVVYTEYGEVCLDETGFDIGELDVEDGDIKCTNINSRSLKIENEYGDCSLSGAIMGLCQVEMENGSLQIDTILAENMYSISAATESGTLCIGDMYQDDYECRYNGGSGSNILKLFSEYGDVKVNFGADNHDGEVHGNHDNHK